MASTGNTAGHWLALGGLGVLLVLLLWPWPLEHRSRGEAAVTAEALARWEQLWQSLETEGVESLAPEVAGSGLQPAGDTAFMRYRDFWRQVEPAALERFQRAALANNPQTKLQLLESLQRDPDPRLRYRAWLERARIELRARNLEAAETAARRALAVEGIEPLFQADAPFILGYIALERGELERADQWLEAAIQQDPGFWDARQSHLLVLVRLLERPRGAGVCLDRTRRLIEHLGALPALAGSRSQFRDIADRLRTVGGDNPALLLAAALGRRWAGDQASAREWLTAVREGAGRLPGACGELVRARAAHLLEGP